MLKLKGVFTALVTPFNDDGTVDYGALRANIQWQIEEGVSGMCPVGTTGESPTLSPEDHLKVIEATVDAVNGQVAVIAGTGANSTEEALHLTKEVQDLGVSATLQVTPYYNKPNAEGLYRHFAAVADLGVPVVLYNVPGRSAKEIPLSVVARLAQHPNVCAIKEAAGSVDRVSAIRQIAPDLTILSGDDGLTLPMISVGAEGVISVCSNVIPREMSQMVAYALEGDYAAARTLHETYYPLFRDMFCDTNPIPVKAALAMMGRIRPVYRLPLCEPDAANAELIRKTLTNLNLI
ncbi:MAG: 4-hydroxy-tetrahydrodipicolinate synthase [Kiritimatiellae bacterium]|nr:4-hydroxy-tetrahydrodipicolinate synthase [Kiritimatiellia bacterium]